VLEIVDVDLEAPAPNGFQGVGRDGISCAGNQLKGGLDTKGIVDIHEVLQKSSPTWFPHHG